MTRHLIGQQYYTRGRAGVFRSNEGYDTVAKSPGLDSSFVKKVLHPFCVYDAPRELQEREADPGEYPEALVSFRAETGELVIGNSVYAGADFTGQRNTFFSHNYVIPAARQEEFIRHPRKIFGIDSFAKRHDEGAGKELPALEDLPYAESTSAAPRQALARMGIGEHEWKQLLYAVMVSLSARKKVFISLAGGEREAAQSAKELMEILYGCLPYEMRRHLGFLTYSGEPQSKKHIHVMFVPKGSIRPGNGHIDKEFLFDFAGQRIWNADLQEGEHEYLHFAWEYLQEPRVMEEFFLFAEEVLAGDDSGLGLRPGTYYELCALFLIEKGRMAVYEQSRAAVWQVLLGYLENAQLTGKKRLYELLASLFREEKKELAARKLPATELVRLIIQSSRVVEGRNRQTERVLYLMDVLLKGRLLQEKAYLDEVYKHLAACPELFSPVMNTALRHEQFAAPLFEAYVAQRLSAALRMEDVLREVAFWEAHVPDALRNPFFKEATQKKMLATFKGSGQKVEAALAIHRFLEPMQKRNAFASDILDEIDRCLLKYTELDALTPQEFAGIVSLLEDKPQTFFWELDLESRATCDLLLKLASLQEGTGGDCPPPEVFYRSFDQEERYQLQRLLRKLLGEKLDEPDFPKVWLAFYETESGGMHSPAYEQMLTFVQERGGEQIMRSFIRWTLSVDEFFRGTSLTPVYRDALKRYFLEEKGIRLRKKEQRKQWYGLRHAELRKLLDEVRDETANGLVRLFRRHTGIMAAVTLLIVAGGTAGGFYLYAATQAPATDQTVEPGPDADPGATPPGGTESPAASDPLPPPIYGPFLPGGDREPGTGSDGETSPATGGSGEGTGSAGTGNDGASSGGTGGAGAGNGEGNPEGTGGAGTGNRGGTPGETGSADTGNGGGTPGETGSADTDNPGATRP
ncbi:hypothetical protein KDJ56_21345 [Brevibacillus composti]|uniref:Glycosyltransferase n=1 Tax=Brevibacillus composti TaxID=2796470 RepID=A0A7T5EKK6_9BACL|nr:hypothetical protein [Brevibacillus composti]QQE74344.1 hypothetical protein JD108_21410 [Brevibacillus composti]QUO41426.1 hypothetical protein KDJ56_21345 [Brevibacillus composti]